nr:MAG TPA: hypothetical protein [Caudoviricetes sp.]
MKRKSSVSVPQMRIISVWGYDSISFCATTYFQDLTFC